MMKDNNSNIRYGAGFKSIDSSKINDSITKSLYRPQSHILAEEDIMGEVGVTKSKFKSQPKYRDENQGVGKLN